MESGTIYRDSIRLTDPGTYRLRFFAGEAGEARVHSNAFEIK